MNTCLARLTLICIIKLLCLANGNAEKNPLATLTEVSVRFYPAIDMMEVNCKTRYNITDPDKISFYYNDVGLYRATNTSHLYREMREPRVGEYVCKVGDDEATFTLSQSSKVLSTDSVEFSFRADLVSKRIRLDYETFEENSEFVCYDGNDEMEMAFHNFGTAVVNKGYVSTMDSKKRNHYKCTFKNGIDFEFYFSSHVEDLYPRISNFKVEFLPSDRNFLNFKFICQSHTARNPKISLYVNKVLLSNTQTNEAVYEEIYLIHKNFKCIIENDYGRDVISWKFDHNLSAIFMDPSDTFIYEVNVDKQVTNVTYKSLDKSNLEKVTCKIKNPKPYSRNASSIGPRGKVFIEALDKEVAHTCQLKKGEIQMFTYTKDYVPIPKLDEIFLTVDLKLFNLRIACRENVPNSRADYAMIIYNGDKLLNYQYLVREHVAPSGISAFSSNPSKNIKCVIKNEMGFDEIEMNYAAEDEDISEIQFRAGFLNNNTIKSHFVYNRISHREYELTNCTQNDQQMMQQKEFYLQSDLQDGKYSCKNRAEVNCLFNPYDCHTVFSQMSFNWFRKSKNYFPDGSLKKEDEK